MLKEIKLSAESLGSESYESLGFEKEEDLEAALLPLMRSRDIEPFFWFHL